MNVKRYECSLMSIPPKARGNHFYKYAEFVPAKHEWAREIILDHRLYLPTLSQLNDPADGRPKLAPLSENELHSFLLSSPYGVIGRNPSMLLEEQLMEATILEANIRHHGLEAMQRRLSECLNAQLEGYRVYSLSKRFDNMNLWAKYAGNHSGYCLEFANNGDFFGCAREVVYCKAVQLDLNNPDLNGYWFFCKSEGWSNEEEIRIVIKRGGESRVQFNPAVLTRLILGWRMSEKDQEVIRTWAKERNPELNVVSAYYDPLDQQLKLTCP
jgi:hypothetical protein